MIGEQFELCALPVGLEKRANCPEVKRPSALAAVASPKGRWAVVGIMSAPY